MNQGHRGDVLGRSFVIVLVVVLVLESASIIEDEEEDEDEDEHESKFRTPHSALRIRSMFDTLPLAPPDSILGLTEAFKKDPNPRKINLSVGVFKDEQGNTPILACVKEAERRLLATEKNKGYLSIEGHAEYDARVQELLFGPGHEILTSKRAVTAQTPGGTGSLRVAADFLKKHFPAAKLWHSKPTWANHRAIFTAAGLKVETYPYLDAAGRVLDFPAMLAGLAQIPAGDVVLLHACCHNPTGIDPTREQWKKDCRRRSRAKAAAAGRLRLSGLWRRPGGRRRRTARAGPAGQGPARVQLILEELWPLRRARRCAHGRRQHADAAERALRQVRISIRTNYSNPPTHGAAIVAAVLGDPQLRQQWEAELAAMRERIHKMRRLFVDTMKQKAPQHDFALSVEPEGDVLVLRPDEHAGR